MSDGRGTDIRATLSQIQDIDDEGLWVTARDKAGLEIEIEIAGLTPEILKRFLNFSFKDS